MAAVMIETAGLPGQANLFDHAGLSISVSKSGTEFVGADYAAKD